MPGMVIAMLLVGAVLVKDGNRKLDEKCAQEVLDGIAESHQECRNYYINKRQKQFFTGEANCHGSN